MMYAAIYCVVILVILVVYAGRDLPFVNKVKNLNPILKWAIICAPAVVGIAAEFLL